MESIKHKMECLQRETRDAEKIREKLCSEASVFEETASKESFYSEHIRLSNLDRYTRTSKMGYRLAYSDFSGNTMFVTL